eukprot:scaffold1687_cov405-Prasinococcus_capsulatus_cf.AAC.6
MVEANLPRCFAVSICTEPRPCTAQGLAPPLIATVASTPIPTSFREHPLQIVTARAVPTARGLVNGLPTWQYLKYSGGISFVSYMAGPMRTAHRYRQQGRNSSRRFPDIGKGCDPSTT